MGAGHLFVLLVLGVLACDSAATERRPSPANARASSHSAPTPAAAVESSASEAAPAAGFLVPSGHPEPGIKLSKGGSKAMAGRHGLVTSVEPQATRVGVQILEQGGNAVDAAVATAYALSVTHPSAASIGGGGFMLISQGRRVSAIDFREDAPHQLPRARFGAMIRNKGIGPDAVGVPGTVAGLELARERFGRLSRRAVMQPAIQLAGEGYRLSPRQHLSLGWKWHELRKNPEFAARFGTRGGGRPRPAGSKLERPELARTLSTIADRGSDAFYREELGRQLLADLGPNSLISADDLSRYRAKLREPLVVDYRGLKVVTMPPPSAGGVALAQTLLMLEEQKAHEHARVSPTALHLLIEASKRAHAERRFHVVDPETLSPSERQQRWQRWLDPTSLISEAPIDLGRATPAREIHPLFESREESDETTHFSVVDAQGMAVSCTITLSAAFGAQLLSKSTGVILNNAVASFSTSGDNQPIGGRRTISSMAPTLVFHGETLGLVLGSPGGDTIPNTISQVLRNVVDYGMTIDHAVSAPRIHHGFIPDEVRFEHERPISPQTRAALTKLGHRFSKKSHAIGDANNVLIVDGTAFAVADPREGGLALSAGLPPSPDASALLPAADGR